MAKQQFNRRLSDEAISAINWWAKADSTAVRKVTDTEIVEQAIAMYDAHRAGTGLDASGPGVSDGRGKATVDAVDAVVEVVDGRPKNARCKHCGNMFVGARFATICAGCKSVGHTLMPGECPACGERGTGGL